jgi:hypothetical protein
MDPPKSRPSTRTIAFSLLGLAMIVAAALNLYWGRGWTFGGDEIGYASRLSQQSLGHAMLYPPPGGYLIAAPLAVYRLMFETLGLTAYLPYRVVGILLALLCAGLFYALARRRVGDLWAIVPTVLLLLFGYGWDHVLTSARLPGSIALAAGLGTLLALERESRRRDLAAALLLTLSLASHPLSLAFVSAAAVLVLTRASPRRWRSIWVFGAPLLLYAAWWVLLRPADAYPMQWGFGATASFVGESWTATTEAVTGLAGVLNAPIQTNPVGWIAGGLLVALVVGSVAMNVRRFPPSFWAVSAALLTLMLSTAATRGNAFLMAIRPADSPRYLYPQAFLLLLLLVEVAGATRPATWIKIGAATVLALGLAANVSRLDQVSDGGRSGAAPVRTSYGAIEIAQDTVSPSYRPLGSIFPDAGAYLDLASDFGSFAYTADQLRAASPSARLLADETLTKALDLNVAPAKHPPSTNSCVELAPSGGPAVIALPANGILLNARHLADVQLKIGRFSDVPSVPLNVPDFGRHAVLAIPADRSNIPWEAAVSSRHRVSVCGLSVPS